MRIHPEPTSYLPPPQRPSSPAVQPPAKVLFAVGEAEQKTYAGGSFPRLFVHATDAAVSSILNDRSRLVTVDLDAPSIDGLEICRAAKANRQASVLVVTADVGRVPAALKAGCDGVLLKPFPPNLLAARVGRLLRELPDPSIPASRRLAVPTGTNRVWPLTACPTCGTTGATSFDFASYRRMWYACLSCDATWMGRRQE